MPGDTLIQPTPNPQLPSRRQTCMRPWVRHTSRSSSQDRPPTARPSWASVIAERPFTLPPGLFIELSFGAPAVTRV